MQQALNGPGLSEILFYAISFFFPGYFGITSLIYLLSGKRTTLKKFKIQKDSASQDHIVREIKYSFFSSIIFTLSILLTFILFDKGYSKIYKDIESYSITYLISSFFIMLIIHDFYFYCTHRLLHLPYVYKKVHKLHHSSYNPTPFSAFSFHPAEAVIQAAIIPIICVILPVHIYALLFFVVYNVLINIVGHSGYEFFSESYKSSWLGKYSNSPMHHNMHHKNVKGNYGLYFSIWDKIFRTEIKE